MNSLSDLQRLLYKVSREYYENQLTQHDIAKRLGLSRIKVSRLLKQARQEHIVSITLTPPPGLLAELEEGIEKKYGLEEVRVVMCEDYSSQSSIISQLAPSAVECLLRRIQGHEVIGVAMGKTMMSVVNRLPTVSLPDVTIVQMNGGLGHIVTLEQSAELARQMAGKLSAQLRLLHAPGVAKNEAAARVFKSDPLIAETLALAAQADIAILSIGLLATSSSALRSSALLTDSDIAELTTRAAVGDIALRFFDSDGTAVQTTLDERIIGLSHAQLQAIPCVISVAGGEEKIEVIRAGLKSCIPNVLVTDQHTAEQLLKD